MTTRFDGEWKSGVLTSSSSSRQHPDKPNEFRDIFTKEAFLLLDDKIIYDFEVDNWHDDEHRDDSKYRAIYHGHFEYDNSGKLYASNITDWSFLVFQTYYNPINQKPYWTRESGYSYGFTDSIRKKPSDGIDFHSEADYANFEYDPEGLENQLEDRSEALKRSKVSTDGGVIERFDDTEFMASGWHKKAFQEEFYARENLADNYSGSGNQGDTQKITEPTKFKIKAIDKITNFNPSTDFLEIDTNSFGIDVTATFAAGKNKKTVKKKLAKQDFNFLYDQKKGGLYFNENGAEKGFGDGGIIAILKGAPELTLGNLDFI